MNLMKKMIRFSFLFLMALAVFTSCSKDDDLEKEITNNNTGTNGTITNPTDNSGTNDDRSATRSMMVKGEDSLCVNFIYPMSFQLPDRLVTVTSEAALFRFFENWEEENPDAEEFPTLVFPIRVQVDGNVEIITNEDELFEALEGCEVEIDGEVEIEVEEEFEFCFDFVYPLSIQFPNGETEEVNDLLDLFEKVTTWYVENGDSEEDITFVYPIQIEMEGNLITINTDEELEDAFDLCEYFVDECFTINYPISIRLESNEVEVNSTYELATVIEEYEENNPNGADPEIIFPITINRDGEEITINSEEELEAIFDECFDDECRVTNVVLGSPKNAVEQVVTGMRYNRN